jgi:hypothetical protein
MLNSDDEKLLEELNTLNESQTFEQMKIDFALISGKRGQRQVFYVGNFTMLT